MGCIWLAMERAGIQATARFSSEIDKFANIANQNKYPDTVQVGDIEKINGGDFGKIDLLVGGSPCQGFSFAGKMLKFYDPRSKLFFDFVRVLDECRKINPDLLFLLENVCMDKRSENTITRILGVNPVMINSSLVSAQNRERNYWTNINQRRDGFFGELKTFIPQPADRGIYLRDILQPLEEIDTKYLLSDAALKRILKASKMGHKVNPEKAGCLTLSNTCKIDNTLTIIKVDVNGKPKKNQDKASCLTAGAHSAGNHSDMDIIVQQANRTIELTPRNDRGGKRTSQTARIYDEIGKHPTLNTSANPVIMQRERGFNKGGEFAEKSPTLTANSFEHNHTVRQSVESQYIYRRVTPIEGCRLQGVPEDYFNDKNGNRVVSDSQLYKMLGNGWQVDTIAHILSFI